MTGPMSAQSDDSTTVSLAPGETTASPGETVSFDIVAENVDGGVGAHTTTVEIGDASIGTITSVDLLGGPDRTYTSVAEDGDSAEMTAALMDTTDSGPVTIGRVTVSVAGAGQTSLSLNVDTLSDANGYTYAVSEMSGATLQTQEGPSVSGEGDTIPPTGVGTLTLTASSVTSLTIENLWTDWTVTPKTPAGGEPADRVATEGAFELSWTDPSGAVSPVVEVEPPEQYIGGTYALDVTASNGSTERTTTITLTIE